MPAFPQLATGASGQYPLVKRLLTRTVVNTLPDGTAIRYADPSAAFAEWGVELTALSAQEWAAIQTLFEASKGRLQTFIFLDPTDNLLLYSEDFSQGAWIKDPLLQIASGAADPFGTTRASTVVNAGQAPQSVRQSISAPGGYRYCFSVYAQSAGGSGVTLTRSTASASQSQSFVLTSAWQRVTLSGNLGASETTVSFAIELQPGASVQLFGVQAEAQLGASPYKQTINQSGVYANARFQDDRLLGTAQSSAQTGTLIRIVAAS
jgi:hypothetical protein